MIIVTYNSAEVLPQLLDSLPAAIDGVSRVSVAVVDNDSVDNSAALGEDHPVVDRVVRVHRNLGFAGGVNVGVKEVQPSEGYLLLNADTRPEPGTLQSLIAGITTQNIGIVVPRLLDSDGGLLPSLRREPSILRALGEGLLGGRRASRFAALSEIVSEPSSYEQSWQPRWATGAAWLVTRRCHEAVGGWDERYFLYSEETDFAARASDAGFAVKFQPDARVGHIGGNLSKSPFLWGIQALNRVRYYRSRHGPLASAVFRLAVALNELMRSAEAVHRAGLMAVLTNRRPDEAGAIEPDSALGPGGA